MKIHINPIWIISDVKARIDTPSTPLIKAKLEEENAINIIKINICWNLMSSASEKYELNTSTFNNRKPEEFLALMNNFKTAINGTGTESVSGGIKCLLTIYLENIYNNLMNWRVKTVAKNPN